MDNDDLPVGRLLNRREVLALVGTTGAAVLIGGSIGQTETQAAPDFPSCIVTPELTEGPYYLEENLNRSDIRAGSDTGEVKEGVPLVLTLRVFEIGNGCEPLPGATVEV